MYKGLLATLVAACGLVAVTGCGDEGDDFVAQADEICRDFVETRIAAQPDEPVKTADQQLDALK